MWNSEAISAADQKLHESYRCLIKLNWQINYLSRGTDVGFDSESAREIIFFTIKHSCMKKYLLLFALMAVSVVVSTSVTAAGITRKDSTKVAPANPTQDIPVAGTFATGVFNGTLDVIQFTRVGRQIYAVGSLTGTLTDLAGNTIGTVTSQQVQLPVSQISSSCDILHLDLGPLDLNLLGLVVHLDEVVLDITADAGPGNLLGNLLCTVTHLLDGPGSIIAIINILNHILGAL